MNVFIDIDIFKSDLIEIDIDIDIFKTCRYIDNRYGLSIYRAPLLVGGLVDCNCSGLQEGEAGEERNVFLAPAQLPFDHPHLVIIIA